MAQEIYHRSNWGSPTETWGNSYLNADLTNELYKRASEYENSWVTDQLLNGVGTKPSIILTPTAYEDGVLNSVKPQKTFGSELVPSIATIVNLGGGSITQISGNSYSSTSDGTSGSTVRPKIDFATTSGKTYKLVITPIGTVTGTVNFDFYDGSTYLFQNYDFTSTKEITFTHNGSVFGAFDGTQTYSISNFTISIKEIIDADFDFTRGSSATRVNEQGLVEDVTDTDLPRINYTDGEGSLLLEPQSTNLLTYSEDFSQSDWSKFQTIVEAATITLPNGLSDGYKLFASTTGGTNHWIEKSSFPTATTGQDYTLSLFVKSAGSDFIQIASSTGFPAKYQNFNISTGTKANGDISDSSITDFGNGWYRISVTETTIATSARYLIVPILSDGARNPQFSGNADEDGVYIWGAQLEDQSYATSYIPTNGSTVTRLADVCNNSGSSDLINSTEGVLYVEALLKDTGTFKTAARITATDTSTADGLWIYFRSDNKIQSVLRVGGVDQAGILSNTQTTDEYYKVAFKFKQNDFALWVNGTEVDTDTSGNTFSADTLSKLGFVLSTSTNPFIGNVKCLAVFKEALSDTELQKLTTI